MIDNIFSFERRHIGPSKDETRKMLDLLDLDNIDQLIDETVPETIRLQEPIDIPEALTEFELLHHLKQISMKNKVYKNFIGQGYYGTVTPSVIARNIFQNPGWYTQYTPYQAEIAQGRLESLLNYQTVVADLTGLPVANASLLDEATAAAEAMAMMEGIKNKRAKTDKANRFLVDENVFSQTIDVLKTRALPLDIEVVVAPWKSFELDAKVFGVLLQYPDSTGEVNDYSEFVQDCKKSEIMVCVAADILSLALLVPPGEWGADIAVGNTQRFGIPLGYGGPHAAYFATSDEYKRLIPGRIIGISQDATGAPALRMALQTREQHIRREKATSNICTAQALLANMAAMYAVYHGPKGIKAIAEKIYQQTAMLKSQIVAAGFEVITNHHFDTITIEVGAEKLDKIKSLAEEAKFNFFYNNNRIGLSVGEDITDQDIQQIIAIFENVSGKSLEKVETVGNLPDYISRQSEYLTHPIFSSYGSETEMMRYIKRLENKDLSLTHSMIALGSCTMKLNAATELIPLSWSHFADIHPFAPVEQTEGYYQIFEELSEYLNVCTGFTACSLQPNSGAQGEYTGLLTIRAYHEDRGDHHRKIALIPSSAHGTNPASAVMAGMEVEVVACDEKGNIDAADLEAKAIAHKDNLSCLMITYPSTHGVFETGIKQICKIIHDNGGLVYMDGANMNAQVGLTNPGTIGADVCHLNLHKTFAIPHGGGGPGMGPICVNDKLAPYLPGHVYAKTGGQKAIHAVSAAAFGSASILLISYAYIRMLGSEGLTNATRFASLNANYIKARLEKEYSVLYTGSKGRAAHELIIDLRPFKALITAEDLAKRLIDFGFHAPTLSFPVAGTIMIEPTESEGKAELDRFCDAMLEIRKEIDEIANGTMDAKSNTLTNAPHTAMVATANEWPYSYSREKAVYPLPYIKDLVKYWPSVSRVDNAFGDRNLVCTCPPIEEYMK
ncbi:MAG: aminomethyl-transferring glycine dehydrogenase [Saprospiraceae bacterium]|nr:aminomethyl-transferring glycine dehydrogenase [Saprospiraceae bacterium]